MIILKRVLFFSSILVSLQSQDLSDLFREVETGNIQEVRNIIPDLRSKYPNSDSVAFLAALVKERAEEAIIAYKSIVQNYPDSPYTDDAIAKIGEYLYARGLYTQASREMSRLPREYPTSEHLQRAIDLQINSLLAIGENDSARYYVNRYGIIFPSLDFNYDFSSDSPLATRPLGDTSFTPLSEGMRKAFTKSTKYKTDLKPSSVVEDRNLLKDSRESFPSSKLVENNTLKSFPVSKPFVVQVGAFGAKNNALRQVQRLEESGFDAEVWPVTVKGKNFFAVQIIRFSTRSKAEAIGRRLKKELNLSYLVVNRPES
ncbi:MAG: hypothetical protein CMG75_10380 [Candidatus Marinimicrobia bacterium]|nr:hypothetical protein [Candidatus Neomarinimicrobiota bacterium]|tara:strand:- start:2078 stop:3022 length:945 start_codon:yes stop_codon:yes gene_type:complete